MEFTNVYSYLQLEKETRGKNTNCTMHGLPIFLSSAASSSSSSSQVMKHSSSSTCCRLSHVVFAETKLTQTQPERSAASEAARLERFVEDERNKVSWRVCKLPARRNVL